MLEYYELRWIKSSALKEKFFNLLCLNLIAAEHFRQILVQNPKNIHVEIVKMGEGFQEVIPQPRNSN